jgi:hypothetical protein
MAASRPFPISVAYVKWGSPKGTGACRHKYSGNGTPKPLDHHANFVINFCQIVFDPETMRIATHSLL